MIHYDTLIITKLIIFLYSIALPNYLVLFLAFCKDRDISPDDLTASSGVADSVWGDISRFIFGRNRASFRKNLYLKWKNNSHDIHNKMKQHKLNTSISRFQVCIRLDVLSIEIRISMITTTILRDICARIQGNESITKLSPSQLNLATIELEILECDNILLICSSVSSDLEIYDKLKSKYSNDTIDYENSLGERLFHSFIIYESKLWLDGFSYYSHIGPKIISGFLQYFEICQFETCKEFEESFGNLFSDKLIEEGTLLRLWLMSTPELNDLDYRLVNNLFDKNYILLSVGVITDFVHWVDKVKSDFEENGIEVLNSIYTDSISILEKNAKNQISDAMDTTIEMENNTKNHTDLPSSSKTCENSNYEGEFYLEKDVWHVISYIDEDNTHHMNRGWTDIIAERFTDINPICVLKLNTTG